MCCATGHTSRKFPGHDSFSEHVFSIHVFTTLIQRAGILSDLSGLTQRVAIHSAFQETDQVASISSLVYPHTKPCWYSTFQATLTINTYSISSHTAQYQMNTINNNSIEIHFSQSCASSEAPYNHLRVHMSHSDDAPHRNAPLPASMCIEHDTSHRNARTKLAALVPPGTLRESVMWRKFFRGPSSCIALLCIV